MYLAARQTYASLALSTCILAFAVGCNRNGGIPAASAALQAASPSLAQSTILAALGRSIFFDTSLSGSGQLACASCHDPAHSYAPANNRAVQLGGAALTRSVFRAVPSLMYTLARTPNYHKETAASLLERIEEPDNPPFGGFAWDGRFKTLHEQAASPLRSADEMDGGSDDAILAKVQRAPYAQSFKQVFGDQALTDASRAVEDLAVALQEFELKDASFHPYTSKFDAALDGKALLTPQEVRGQSLFNDAKRGNCNSCHNSDRGADGSHPLFTNYQFEALAVPRNPEIPANRDPKFYDLGLCGPLRTDLKDQANLCGMFKTPSLRNVATRGAYFHNGRFHTLREALRFYVRRDTNPEQFYPKGPDGKTRTFDDLPAKYRRNADIVDLPLTKHPGEQPVWSEQEIDDVVAFLSTLTDGYKTRH